MIDNNQKAEHVLHIRITDAQKRALLRYCTAHDRSTAQAIRVLVSKQLKEEAYLK
jgi:hypothetical protein